MTTRRSSFILLLVVFGGLFLFLNIHNLILSQKDDVSGLNKAEIRQKLELLAAQVALEHDAQAELEEQILEQQKRLKEVALSMKRVPTLPVEADSSNGPVIAIIVFACDRVDVSKALDDLIKYRPNADQFPIVVSQDCSGTAANKTAEVISGYQGKILKHIRQPDQSPIQGLVTKKDKAFEGYYKISRHYKFGLSQMFDVMNYDVVIVMEDDLQIAPDFYDYFLATSKILKSDPTVYCVSAWNDNGKREHIDTNSPELLYRTDFFPGLGWMLTKSLWDEFRDKWPPGFWDDWVRKDEQRKSRSCIRPEVSRTHTFGKVGVSKGLFFNQHLQYIVLNDKPVSFLSINMDYLDKSAYDRTWVEKVYGSPSVALNQLKSLAQSKQHPSVRLQYTSKATFKTIAKTLKIMDDFKDGVPRCAYRGVVPITFEGLRVYIAPAPDWKAYDPTWS